MNICIAGKRVTHINTDKAVELLVKEAQKQGCDYYVSKTIADCLVKRVGNTISVGGVELKSC